MLLDSKLALAIGKSLSDLCSSPSPISMTESAGTHRDVTAAGGLESPGEFQHKGLRGAVLELGRCSRMGMSRRKGKK